VPDEDQKRESQRIHPRYKDDWPKFLDELDKRLSRGHREYGDRSFERPAFSLLEEVQEEILDIPNWAFIAWTRIETLKVQLKALEDTLGTAEMDRIFEDFKGSVQGDG